jgi:hypothetical protein
MQCVAVFVWLRMDACSRSQEDVGLLRTCMFTTSCLASVSRIGCVFRIFERGSLLTFQRRS